MHLLYILVANFQLGRAFIGKFIRAKIDFQSI